jgi:hypothetical protein
VSIRGHGGKGVQVFRYRRVGGLFLIVILFLIGPIPPAPFPRREGGAGLVLAMFGLRFNLKRRRFRTGNRDRWYLEK